MIPVDHGSGPIAESFRDLVELCMYLLSPGTTLKRKKNLLQEFVSVDFFGWPQWVPSNARQAAHQGACLKHAAVHFLARGQSLYEHAQREV